MRTFYIMQSDRIVALATAESMFHVVSGECWSLPIGEELNPQPERPLQAGDYLIDPVGKVIARLDDDALLPITCGEWQ